MIGRFLENEGIFFYRELPVEELLIWDERKFQRMEEKIGKVKSAVIFLIPYFAGQKTTTLSVYAQPKDYHLYLKELSQRLEFFLKEIGAPFRFCGFTDSSPIAERDAALRAGLGVLGKNGLVMNHRYGSYFFIGEFFLSQAISPERGVEVKSCMGCSACERACPTGAVLDPQRKKCLSFISQKKQLTDEERELLESATCKWGCDLCQSVCPMNRGAEETPIPFFREDHVTELTPEVIESPKEDFLQLAFSWRGREILRRNIKK